MRPNAAVSPFTLHFLWSVHETGTLTTDPNQGEEQWHTPSQKHVDGNLAAICVLMTAV